MLDASVTLHRIISTAFKACGVVTLLLLERNRALAKAAHTLAIRHQRNAGCKAFAMLFLLFSQGDALLAQTSLEANNAIQFNLVIPGARSLALGGAFLARADDNDVQAKK